MKQPHYNEPDEFLKCAFIFLIWVALATLIFGCSVTKQPQYKVTSIERIKWNAYKVTTDSFKVIRIVRGAGKYHPKTISKQGYKL